MKKSILALCVVLGMGVSPLCVADDAVCENGSLAVVKLTLPDGTKADAAMTCSDAKKFDNAKGVEAHAHIGIHAGT